MHLTQAIKRACQINGNGLATICGDRRRTWLECKDRVAKMAGALRKLGICDGERAGILSLNSDRYFEAYIALPWAAAAFVPINGRLAAPEMAYWLNDSESKALFIDEPFVGMMADLKPQLETVEHYIYVGDGETPEGMLNYEEILAAADPVEDAGAGYDDMAGILYTGGTTGKSKGVMLSHANLVANTMNVIPALNYRPGMRWLYVPPMFHIAGSVAVTGVTMVAGTNVFVPAFEPTAVLTALQDEKITDLLMVPTMINMMVNSEGAADYDLSNLEVLSYGASPMPADVIRKTVDLLPDCEFVHAYGQTETSPLISMNGADAHRGEGLKSERFKSCGPVVMNSEVKVVDENDNPVANGIVGELCVRGPIVMLGYWKLPEQTAEAVEDGWMHTGDGAYIDDTGYIYIVDRTKDMIISGGENVYSAEVENTLYQHPAVIECAVVGVPDDKWGERVHAIVRLHEGQSLSEEDLMAFCHTLIAGFKCPRSILFREEPLPLSGAGKILKRELRVPYWEGQEKQVH
jgi:long-chain acyl-CoA synthetase